MKIFNKIPILALVIAFMLGSPGLVALAADPSTATLHVIKLVINRTGSAAIANDFNVYVKSYGNNVNNSPALGRSAPGTSYSLLPGTYVISEDNNATYLRYFIGDCDYNGSITLAAGNDKTCTIVNTNIPEPIAADNSNNTNSSTNVVPLIGVSKVPTPLTLPNGSNLVTYNYTVWNVDGQQALTNIKVTDDKCTTVTLLSGDLNNNNKLDPNENWKYSCTTNLSETTMSTVVATGYNNDIYRQVAVATAVTTVVVGGTLSAPIINIVQRPSRLVPFPFGGGEVNYYYNVTNPGTVPIQEVTLTDNRCRPIFGPSGDNNSNNLLDPGETWIYSCLTNVSVSTRNIVVVNGHANGFNALGYAFANVLVSSSATPITPTVPGLPETGLPPEDQNSPWNIILLVGIAVIALTETMFIIKKWKT